MRDLWAHTTTTTSGTISASVPAHGAAMYIVTGGGTTNPARQLRGCGAQGSGRCLDITGASQANGALAEIWDCNGGANQRFTHEPPASCASTTAPSASTSTTDGTANGTAVEIWDCNGQPTSSSG